MIAVSLEEDLEKRLEHLSRETGRSKSYYVKQAIENYLDDREDYLFTKNGRQKYLIFLRMK